jgi:hypothetical protein
MSGIRQGFRAGAKAIDPQAMIFDCLIHMGIHASMKLSEKMDIVKREVIQVVNCNRVRLLNNSIFNQTCSIAGSTFATSC